MLKFIEDECARTGLLSCKQSVITKATRVFQKTISDSIRTLAADGHIKVIRNLPSKTVPGLMGVLRRMPAFPI